MVGLIGLATMVALVWLLDFSMANESDAERRRIARSGTASFTDAVGQDQDGKGTRVAA